MINIKMMTGVLHSKIKGAMFIGLMFTLLWVPIVQAESLKAAVAANFIEPFNEIAAVFEKETNVKVDATFSSSGNLYAQIINGAPYDLFLSADEERPAALFQKGIATKPFVYAVGRVVLWGKEKNFCGDHDWQAAVGKNHSIK